jgi:negative regulator of replication initiation
MNPILEQIKPETAEMIATQASASGLSVDDYLKRLLGMPSGTETASEASLEESMAAMESLAEDDLTPLPRDFSREDIYFPEG